MILSIPADHPSVFAMLRGLGNDIDPMEADRHLEQTARLTERRPEDLQILAVDMAHDGLNMLLRRREDGVLMHSLLSEEDSGETAAMTAAMVRLTPQTGATMAKRFGDWARRSEMRDAREVLAKLLDDAIAIDEPRADVVLDDRIAMEDVLTTAADAVPDLRDDRLREIVRQFIRDANARLTA